MRTCFKTLMLGALITSCLGSSSPAFAENRDAMVKMSQEAAKLFQEGKFEQAAKRFNDASKESWEPILVKNEMIAWYKAERCEEAIKAANTYLERTKPEQIVEQDRQDSHVILFDCHIKAASASMDKGYLDLAEGSIAEASKYKPADATAASRLAGINDRLKAKRAELAAKGKENNTPDPKDPQDPVVEPPKKGTSGQAIAGYSLLGAGALGLIGTAVYSASESGALQDRYDALAGGDGKVYECSSYEAAQKKTCDQLYEDESSAQLLSGIGYGVSGLMLAGGAVLVYLSMQAPEAVQEAPKEDSAASFFPVVGPGQAGVGMRFSF